MKEQRRNPSGEAVGSPKKAKKREAGEICCGCCRVVGFGSTFVYVPVCLCLMCINFGLSSLVG
ncbi:hypothetical protein CTAM01_00895 [Colletotrichum tamarilloi]|uniref:Cysteine-rich transmembrane CYSTM domain-containing protein n=1 Tax=Colletotrichum tamarilloi TaxID=1209934 RepID=A0ABQ9RSH3_9PEZI|nr:uncharacterized protein CTAM01_00895 [Colletotrichum tamarilloi]KAK1511965.1 hypothetical protein CTAM01_00895 [Colletotrichum tamarilloi]